MRHATDVAETIVTNNWFRELFLLAKWYENRRVLVP